MSWLNNGGRSGALLDRQRLHTLVDHLCDLAEKTQPAAGERSQGGKDLRSRCVLTDAGKLLEPLIRWAANHQIGLALAGLPSAPIAPAGHETDIEYAGAKATADDHAHEVAGDDYAFDDPSINRRIVATLLGGLFQGWGPANEVAQGLLALESGEIRPILQPPARKRDFAGYSLSAHRLRAGVHVAFRRGLGMTDESAREVVARNYGVGSDTVKTWIANLRRDLHSRYWLDGAKELGRAVVIRRATIPRLEPGQAEVDTAAEAYSDNNLVTDGRQYQDALIQKSR